MGLHLLHLLCDHFGLALGHFSMQKRAEINQKLQCPISPFRQVQRKPILTFWYWYAPVNLFSIEKLSLLSHFSRPLSSSNHDHQIFISILRKKEESLTKENLCSVAVEEFPLSSFNIVVDFVEKKMMKRGAGHCCKNEMLSKINKRVQAAGWVYFSS